MIKTYFTFDTASHFPYGIEDYVVIEALTQHHAEQEFLKRFPGKDPKTLNCAFDYSESEWLSSGMQSKYYADKAPAEYIVVAPSKKDIRDLVENFVYMSSNAFILGTALSNAFPEKGDDLYNIVNDIHAHELTNVDLIMSKLEDAGYLNLVNDMLEKEGDDEYEMD